MAPEWPYVQGGYISYGSIWGAYIPIINALRNDLTVLHPQYYNNGDIMTPYASTNLRAGSADQLVASSRMLIEGFTYGGSTFAGLRPDQVAFGVPSGSSSANSGFTTATDVSNALSCLSKLTNCGTIKPNAAYSTFRGVMTWSINWDSHDGYNFSKPARAALNAMP
jgi:chitinase